MLGGLDLSGLGGIEGLLGASPKPRPFQHQKLMLDAIARGQLACMGGGPGYGGKSEFIREMGRLAAARPDAWVPVVDREREAAIKEMDEYLGSGE